MVIKNDIDTPIQKSGDIAHENTCTQLRKVKDKKLILFQ